LPPGGWCSRGLDDGGRAEVRRWFEGAAGGSGAGAARTLGPEIAGTHTLIGVSLRARSAWVRRRLGDSGRAFVTTARNRALLYAQLSFAAAWTAEWAFTVALGVVAYDDGGAAAVGLVTVVRMAPSALLAPLGSAFADRFPRDRVLVWACLIRGLATSAAAVVLVSDGPIAAVYASALLATVAFTVFRPAHSALLPALCGTPLELTSANVVRGLVDSLSTLVGPLIAALLLGAGDAALVVAVAAALSFASGALLLGISYEAPHPGVPRPLSRIAGEVVDGFRALARHRDARLVIGVALAQTLTRGFLNVFLVVIAFDVLGLGAPGVGVLTAMVGVGAVAGSLGVSILATGRRLAVLQGVGVALWGIPLVVSGAVPHGPVVVGAMAVIGVGNALVDVGLFTLVSRLVPEQLLARAFGVLESLIALTVAFGSFVTPAAIRWWGLRGSLVALGLVAPALVALAWRGLRRIDATISHRDEEVELLKEVSMLRPLPMPAIDVLALHVRHVEYPAGADVVRQGEPGDLFYVIVEGEADVIGDGRVIRTMGPGDGFGEIALLRRTLRTTTVRARTPLSLRALERRHFVPTVDGYGSAVREATSLVDERLGAFDPDASPGPPAGRGPE
jgi:MFS family permease